MTNAPPRTPDPTGRRANGLVPVAIVVIAVVGLSWLALRVVSDDDSTGPGTVQPGVSHVHGLGINPADGSLVVATHYGSFRIPPAEDTAIRIGDTYQDTMGFTVAGADHFLGSGHPDVKGLGEGLPTRLGLIESVDGGKSWVNLSLAGEADFHGLAFVNGQVYGWDSGTGRFMVSSDRHNWETRSTLDLFGFAVDPDDADHLVGAGPDGPLESTNGGSRWERIEGPRIVTLSWHPDAGLWGADPSGTIWHRDGSGWERAGELPGEPQALLATAEALYAAALEDHVTSIYSSADSGSSWDLRYRDTER